MQIVTETGEQLVLRMVWMGSVEDTVLRRLWGGSVTTRNVRGTLHPAIRKYGECMGWYEGCHWIALVMERMHTTLPRSLRGDSGAADVLWDGWTRLCADVACLHDDLRVAYGDISVFNVGFLSGGQVHEGLSLLPVLIDYGQACNIADPDKIGGTRGFMALEVENYDDGWCDMRKADVYSLACVLLAWLEMCQVEVPRSWGALA